MTTEITTNGRQNTGDAPETARRLDEMSALLQAQQAQLEALKAQVEKPVEHLRPSAGATSSRRQLLMLAGGAVAAAAGATALGARQADAANGDIMFVGSTMSGTQTTFLNGAFQATGQPGSGQGLIGIGGSPSGGGVQGTGAGPNGLGVNGLGMGTGGGVSASGGTTSGPGVVANGGGPDGVGVKAQGAGAGAGVNAFGGISGPGVNAVGGLPNADGVQTHGSGTGSGLVAFAGVSGGIGAILHGTGNSAPLNLVPSASPGSPASGTHSKGDVWVDSGGIMSVCVANGSPGTWLRLAGVASGSSGGAITLLSSPIRVYDSGARIPANTVTHVQITGVHDINNGSSPTVPASATGVVANITAYSAFGGGGGRIDGDLRAFPSGQTPPSSSVLNFSNNQYAFANGATIALDNGGKIDVLNDGADVALIVDVSGYLA